MLESKFKTELIKDLKHLLIGCIILHNDPNEIQGIPDLTVLYKKNWACLEGKRNAKSPCQPNQEYYVDELNKLSFARFIYPENKEEVLDELLQAFGVRRPARIPKSK